MIKKFLGQWLCCEPPNLPPRSTELLENGTILQIGGDYWALSKAGDTESFTRQYQEVTISTLITKIFRYGGHSNSLAGVCEAQWSKDKQFVKLCFSRTLEPAYYRITWE